MPTENIFFQPVFGHFCSNSAAEWPPNLPANQLFSTASYELFCRIFGRLATVQYSHRMPLTIFVYNSGTGTGTTFSDTKFRGKFH
jgi:hypothetical protein